MPPLGWQVSIGSIVAAAISAALATAAIALAYLKIEKRDRGVKMLRIIVVSINAAFAASSIACACALSILAATGWWDDEGWIAGVVNLAAVVIGILVWMLLQREARKAREQRMKEMQAKLSAARKLSGRLKVAVPKSAQVSCAPFPHSRPHLALSPTCTQTP